VVPVDQQVIESETRVQSVITLAPLEGAWPFCSVCGETGRRLHMSGTRRVRDLNLAHARVELVVPNRKLRCANRRTIRTEGHGNVRSQAATTRERDCEPRCVSDPHRPARRINNKIKVIKRQAYGFRDDAYFILKIKGAFPGTCN
jgi:transposase